MRDRDVALRLAFSHVAVVCCTQMFGVVKFVVGGGRGFDGALGSSAVKVRQARSTSFLAPATMYECNCILPGYLGQSFKVETYEIG